jgi:ABC-2 type transport system permease protein
MIRLIALKELRSLFMAPATWFMLAVLMFILSWAFGFQLDAFLQLQTQFALTPNAPGVTEVIVPFLSGILVLLLMLLTPLFTMRLFAEERRNQTLALLLTAPVSATQIVLGKFFGLLILLWLIALPAMLLPVSLQLGTPLDFGLLATNLTGVLLIAACYAAFGLYLSTLTAQPIIAALATLLVLFGLWLAESNAADNTLWQAIAPTSHLRSFSSGLLDSADVVWFVLWCGVFLGLAVGRVDNSHSYRPG